MDKHKQSKIFNPKHTKQQRKYLRNNMTKAEIILWSKLKGKQLNNYKFRRQYGISDYIVDFYCPALELVIEVDGESHYTDQGKTHDKKRTEFIKGLGLTIIRFTNDQVFNNIQGVFTKIQKTAKRLDSNKT